MTKAAHFTQADVARLVKGVVAAGWPVGSFQIVVEKGRLAVLPFEGASVSPVAGRKANPMDRVLAA